MKKLYAEISKVEPQDDGTLKVWGYASSEAIDSDGETILAGAMKAALPDYMKFGAVREMHQPLAAGTAIEANVEEDGRTYFGAHVVDPLACKKVETGVYKGFSIGGKVTGRDDMNKSIITGLKLVEISLVDRPANPEAIITVFKAEGMEDESPTDSVMSDPGAVGGDGGVVDSPGVSKADVEVSETAEPVVQVSDPVNKGMYSVSRLSEILQDIAWLAGETEWESQYEGDNSPLPAELRTWLSMGVDIFRQMAAEETAEMLAALNAMAPQDVAVQVFEQAEATAGLEKAGAKFSAITKEALSNIHKAAKECCDHLDKLGYKQDDEDDADGKEDDEKKAEPIADLEKAMKESEDKIQKMATENQALLKRVKELEAKPAPAKGVLMAISKDAEAQIVKAEEYVDSEGQPLTGEALAKALLTKMYTVNRGA